MDAVSLAVAAGLAGSAKAYADAKIAEAITALPKGVVWRGSVNYYADLPATPDAGDCYTVKYAGSSGTSPSGQEYAWGKYDGVNQWIPIGPDMSVYRTAAAQDTIDSGKADKVASPTAGNFAGLDANGNLTDSGKKAADFLQEHQSLAAYRTSAAQDVIDATKQTKITASGILQGDGSGGVTEKAVDATPTASSTNLITSGAVYAGLDGKQDKLAVIADTTSTTSTLTMAANTKYTFSQALTALTLSTVATNSFIEFTAGSGIAVTVPSTVVWAVADPVFTSGKTYSIKFTTLGATTIGEWYCV